MTVNPVTGQSADEHSAATAGGMAAAHATRQRYLDAVVSGALSLSDVIEFSRGKAVDARYISKLRLVDILRAKPGWTEQTAIEALERHEFTRKDNLTSIRRDRQRITLFVELFDTAADRWRARPEAPRGWPWNGKLSALIVAAGAQMPPELNPTTGGVNTETGEVTEEIGQHELDALFGETPKEESYDSQFSLEAILNGNGGNGGNGE